MTYGNELAFVTRYRGFIHLLFPKSLRFSYLRVFILDQWSTMLAIVLISKTVKISLFRSKHIIIAIFQTTTPMII
jgi:hypothetical protein